MNGLNYGSILGLNRPAHEVGSGDDNADHVSRGDAALDALNGVVEFLAEIPDVALDLLGGFDGF